MTDKKYLETVFKNFVANKYTKEELRDLLDSFSNEGDKAYLMQLIEQHIGADYSDMAYPEASAAAARVLEKLKEHNGLDGGTAIRHVLPRRPMLGLYKIAAAIAVIFIISFVGVYFYKGFRQDPIAPSLARVYDIEPGTNKAKLLLSDGRELSLDDAQLGELAEESGISIHKTSDGQIIYTIAGTESASAQDATNTIRTPRGGQYQIVLPDGTKVWLNSSSSLTYPVHFADTSRQVKVDGEAYFEVAKSVDKKGKRIPFLVDCRDQVVEVLGTHFNVNAYNDEKVVRTTLVTGSVKVSSAKTGASKILKPGQQSALVPEGSISLTEDIDIEEILAWKNETFYFNNTDLQGIMRQLSRWYDIEIDTEGMPNRKFTGVLPRNVKLSTVLKMMEKISDLKFKVDERGVSMSK